MIPLYDLARQWKSRNDLAINRLFVEAGISIIPLMLGGSKKSRGSWKEFQSRLPTEEELRRWYSQPTGTAVVCGRVSGGLEVLDFDADAQRVFPEWEREVADLLCRLPVVETPSGGFHVYYRCPEIASSQPIAKPIQGTKPYIESRGQGGYAASVTNPGEVHELNFPYVQTAGPVLPEVPTISPEERRQLWAAAEKFDEAAVKQEWLEKEAQWRIRQLTKQPSQGGELKPWEDFNARGEIESVLQKHGWRSRDGEQWIRPGKRSGHSATLRRCHSSGNQVFVLFSSSTEMPSEWIGTKTDISAVFTFLECGNDWTEAAKELRKSGYGKQENCRQWNV